MAGNEGVYRDIGSVREWGSGVGIGGLRVGDGRTKMGCCVGLAGFRISTVVGLDDLNRRGRRGRDADAFVGLGGACGLCCFGFGSGMWRGRIGKWVHTACGADDHGRDH